MIRQLPDADCGDWLVQRQPKFRVRRQPDVLFHVKQRRDALRVRDTLVYSQRALGRPRPCEHACSLLCPTTYRFASLDIANQILQAVNPNVAPAQRQQRAGILDNLPVRRNIAYRNHGPACHRFKYRKSETLAPRRANIHCRQTVQRDQLLFRHAIDPANAVRYIQRRSKRPQSLSLLHIVRRANLHENGIWVAAPSNGGQEMNQDVDLLARSLRTDIQQNGGVFRHTERPAISPR